MTTKEERTGKEDVRTEVRKHYGKIATEFRGETSCCSPVESSCGCSPQEDSTEMSLVSQLYETSDVNTLPEEVTGLSLGCGDPVTLATLEPGQTVLDLGSGGGIDCFLAAKQVGASGHVIGVDMTATMLEKARANKEKLGAENVEFRLGEIEHLPVEDKSVDVVISNCVINLSPDKPQVFREAYRVLKPGGRLAVSDIVTNGPFPQVLKDNLSAWAGCISGAMEAKEYIASLEAAGFVDVELTPIYFDKESLREAAKEIGVEIAEGLGDGSGPTMLNLENRTVKEIDLGPEMDIDPGAIQQTIFSAKISAKKP